VERNRIRRRLKEAVRLDASDHARAGHDYVLVGRRSVLSASFGGLRAELAGALRDTPRAGSDGGRRPRSSR
jgi:ribonuclease P protein component